MPWPKGKPRGPSPFKGKDRSPYGRKSPCSVRDYGNPRPALAEMWQCRGCGETWKVRPAACPHCTGGAWERVGARGGVPRPLK